MSRRHHHHNIQPYDYDRFADQTRERGDQTRGIEYQDDSLSSINSDEESYLHHSHGNKEKKASYFVAKTDSSSKKTEKSSNNEDFYQKPTKNNSNTESNSNSTVERLGRLENMLEELLKRNQTTNPSPEKKSIGEKSAGQYSLDPRRHDFTTSMWINKIQEISFQNKWNEKDTIQYMGTQMSGIVKAWYKSLSNFDLTWPELKIQITKIFPDNTEFITTLKRLVTRLRQPDETITTYYFSKMYLIEACKITGEDAVSCLIDGLNNQSIQEQAKSQNFLTPESLYSQFLMILPDYSVDYAPSTPSTETTLNTWYYQESAEEGGGEAASQPEEFIEYEKDEDFEYRNQGNPGMEDNRPHSVKSPPKRGVPVHSRLDKRFIRPPLNHFRRHINKLPMAAKICSICHNRGHLARHCRNVDKMMLCTLSTNQKSCFYINCQINDHTLDAFIDTGCSTVTIKEEIVKMLNLPIKPNRGRLQVYGGGSVGVLGEVNVSIQVDSAKARVRAVVVANHIQEVSVIIGEEFLRRKNVTFNLKHSTVKISEA